MEPVFASQTEGGGDGALIVLVAARRGIPGYAASFDEAEVEVGRSGRNVKYLDRSDPRTGKTVADEEHLAGVNGGLVYQLRRPKTIVTSFLTAGASLA